MSVTQIKAAVKNILRGGFAFLAPLASKKSTMTSDRARQILLNCAPVPGGTGMGSNVLADLRCDLQIVIPAYNVEAYLEACMESVLSQKTSYSFHVVLVDDGAKDNTPAICDKYASDPRVTVIHQKNRGLSGARNTGMQELFGKYVLFVDSDDLLCEGAVEGLMNTALSHDCDLVEGGAYYLKQSGLTEMHRYDREEPVTAPYSRLHGHAWGKLYKRELLENLCFPEGYWYEDSLLSFLVFPLAKRIYRCPQMACAYRINEEGIVKTSVGKPRAVETYWITELLLKERSRMDLPMDESFFSFLLLQLRLNQLRLENLPAEVQEAAFVLSCDLLREYFAPEKMVSREKNLLRALKTADFGMFRMCCKFF